MPAATFSYDHLAGSCVAHVTGATPGNFMRFWCPGANYSPAQFNAPSASFDMTCTAISAPLPNRTLFATVIYDTVAGSAFASTVFPYASDAESTFTGSWTYDGANTVTAQYLTTVGQTYEMDISSWGDQENGTPTVGDGSLKTFTTIKTGAPFPSDFVGFLYAFSPGLNYVTTRVFTPGVAGSGRLGNPGVIPTIPSNDDIQNAIRIYDTGGSDVQSIELASLQPGEPPQSGKTKSVWYVYIANRHGVINFVATGTNVAAFRYRTFFYPSTAAQFGQLSLTGSVSVEPGDILYFQVMQ